MEAVEFESISCVCKLKLSTSKFHSKLAFFSTLYIASDRYCDCILIRFLFFLQIRQDPCPDGHFSVKNYCVVYQKLVPFACEKQFIASSIHFHFSKLNFELVTTYVISE
jgi:hypothetical protein